MKRSFSIFLVVAMIQLVLVSASFADPIHDAVKAGDLAEVIRLIGLDPANRDAPDQYGLTPLHYAASDGHLDIAQSLLAAGANVESRDNFGYTSLHYAAIWGQTAIAQILFAHGANLEARNKFDATPLHYATQNGHTATFQALIAHGADIQVAAGDYALAVEAHHLAQAAHATLGNHEAAGLNHHLATLLAPAVPVKDHLASATGYVQAMESHFETAAAKAGEIQSHRDRGNEDATLKAEAQAQESLESADRSAAEAIVAYETALAALDGALEGVINAHEEARVTDAPAEHLAQYTALMDSLRAQMASVSIKIDEISANAEAGRERVSAARRL